MNGEVEMNGIWTGINTVLIFVILVLPGYYSIKKGVLQTMQIDGLSKILVTFIWPAMVIDAMISVELTAELRHMVYDTLLICLIGYAISAAIAFLYVRIRQIPAQREGITKFSLVFNNTGFIGIPLARMVFGQEALMIASLAEVVCDSLIFTVGIMMMDHTKKEIHLDSILNPSFLSVLLGLVLLFLNLPLPVIVTKTVNIMGSATTALAMFIIGAQLAERDLKELFAQKSCYILSAIRLLVLPAVMYVFLFIILKHRTMADAVLVLMFAMPSASCTAIFARQYHKDYHYATNVVMLTTVLSVLTIPFWLVLVTM